MSAPPPLSTAVAAGAAIATSAGNSQEDIWFPISTPNAPLGLSADEINAAANAAAIGNRFAYAAALSAAGGRARPSLVVRVASRTVALAAVSRKEELIANHTPTIARPMSAETCPEEGAAAAAAAAAVFAAAAGANVFCRLNTAFAALSAATTANAPPAFTSTARQKVAPAGLCASHASR